MVSDAALRKRKQRAKDKTNGKYQIDKEKNRLYNKAKYRNKIRAPSIVQVPYLYEGKYVRRGMNIGAVNESAPVVHDKPTIVQGFGLPKYH